MAYLIQKNTESSENKIFVQKKKTSNESVVATEPYCTISGKVVGPVSSRMPRPLRRSTTPLSFGPVDAGEKGVGPDVVHAPGARPQSLQRVVLEQLRGKGDGEKTQHKIVTEII